MVDKWAYDVYLDRLSLRLGELVGGVRESEACPESGSTLPSTLTTFPR